VPNRIIKESIRTSRKINALSDLQFRVWTYLLTYVDDYGRGDADPELLKGLVFPRRKGLTEKTISDALAELANIGLISLYEVDGESYLCFPTWGEHQRIQQKRSRFPAPEDGNILEVTVNHRESPPESNPIQSESESESKSESESRIQNPKTRRREDVFAEFAAADSDLLKALRDFEAMRKQIDKPLTDRAKGMIVTKLKTFPRDQWIPILEQSILHCWQGVFPLKDAPQDAQPVGKGAAALTTLRELHQMYGGEES